MWVSECLCLLSILNRWVDLCVCVCEWVRDDYWVSNALRLIVDDKLLIARPARMFNSIGTRARFDGSGLFSPNHGTSEGAVCDSKTRIRWCGVRERANRTGMGRTYPSPFSCRIIMCREVRANTTENGCLFFPHGFIQIAEIVMTACKGVKCRAKREPRTPPPDSL